MHQRPSRRPRPRRRKRPRPLTRLPASPSPLPFAVARFPPTGACSPPDGKTLVASEEDGTIKDIGLTNGNNGRNRRGNQTAVKAAAFSPDGLKGAVASEGKTFVSCELPTGVVQRDLIGKQGRDYAAA